MNLTDMTIEEMCTTTEKQLFDRKSAKIDATAIATPMIAFANADGGLLAVGIEDNGEITGVDDYAKNINEILCAGYDFCQPSIFIEKETIDCIDKNGNANHILLIKIPQSADMHMNHRDEAFLRVGDRSKKLTFDERMELMYSKGCVSMRTSLYTEVLWMISTWNLLQSIVRRLAMEKHQKNISDRIRITL